MSFDPTDLKAQQLAIERERERVRLAQLTAEDDFKWLMASERGRRLVWNWLGDCKVFGSPFHQSGSIASFNMGMHAFGVGLFREVMRHCPEQFPVMQAEAISRAETYRAEKRD